MVLNSAYTIRVLNLRQEAKNPAELLQEIRASLNDIISESPNYYPTFLIADERFSLLSSCSVNGGWYDLCSNMVDLSKAFENLVFYVEESTNCGENGYVFYNGEWWWRSSASPFDQLSGEQLGIELPPTYIRYLMSAYKEEVSESCGS